MTSIDYDFIVIGGGPCGSSLATRLSDAPSKPSVLLIEAGGCNEDPASRVAGERNTFWAADGLGLDYGYKTTPQAALNDRELSYHRGKGLGGSTATNIGVWDYGSSPELDEWARLVGDDCWEWEKVQKRYRKIERYHDFTPESYWRYVRPNPLSHGTSGPVDVTYPVIWDPCLSLIFDAVEAHGLPLNPDLSSDRCIGMGVAPATVLHGLRVTASSAYLEHRQENLQILTESPVQRVVFEGIKAKGVELIGGEFRYAQKEVILCAGAIDTPKLLLLSGIGAANNLTGYGISVVLEQPNIGLKLKDHPMIRLGATVEQDAFHHKPLAATADDIAAAAQGYLKLDPSTLPALSSLGANVQSHLLNDRTPTHELLLRIVPSQMQEGRLLWIAVLVLMNCQSQGRVLLRSNSALDAPVIDINLLSHPYDLQVATEAIRSTVQLLRGSSIIPTDELVLGPKSLKDADIVEYVRANLSHLWHACGTVKMGKPGLEGTCVTPDFKVQGLEGLRVADLSVVPIIPSNHIQSTAYLIGEIAADKIIAEYGLGT